jgi:hypothetical protein
MGGRKIISRSIQNIQFTARLKAQVDGIFKFRTGKSTLAFNGFFPFLRSSGSCLLLVITLFPTPGFKCQFFLKCQSFHILKMDYIYSKEAPIASAGLTTGATLFRCARVAAGAVTVFLLSSCLQPMITTSDFCDAARLNTMLRNFREDSLRACHRLAVVREGSGDTLLSGEFENLWPLSSALFKKSYGGISLGHAC